MFENPAFLSSIDVFDIEGPENGAVNEFIELTLADSAVVRFDMPETGGDNTWDRIDLNTTNVRLLSMTMGRSGAIDNIEGAAIPEPASLALLGLSLNGCFMSRRRRKAARSNQQQGGQHGPPF